MIAIARSTSQLNTEEKSFESLGLNAKALRPFVEALGPVAVLDFETTGFPDDPDAEILEIGAVLLDPGRETATTVHSLLRTLGPIPRAIQRLTGICEEDLVDAPEIEEVQNELVEALRGRKIVAHNAVFEKSFLVRYLGRYFDTASYLDTQDLLAITHPDAPDLRLESFTRSMLGSEEEHRGLEDALDTLRVMSKVAEGALAGEPRYLAARQALETYVVKSPWLSLLAEPSALRAPVEPVDFVEIEATAEEPVPFDEEAIAQALADEERGRRYFPGYRVREGQIALARKFVGSLRDGGVILVEGGTGIGKSLAYLAAAIPFAVEQAAGGDRRPVVISTRTKLLQDQLLEKDIAAAARFLGYPELRALSIKGRANYVCARRLTPVLSEGSEPSLFGEDRMAYAALFASARTRPYGEVGTLAPAMRRRFPVLRDLLRRVVSVRADQCSREQCALSSPCSFGKKRSALGRAHLVVANHDLLLRWPPDYPAFANAIVDEVHELAGVADEAYAQEVRPEAIFDCLDEIFGKGSASKEDALLSRGQLRIIAKDALAWRRNLNQDLLALGRSLGPLAGDYGEVQVPSLLDPRFDSALKFAELCADRLDQVALALDRLMDENAESEKATPTLERAVEDLKLSAAGLRLAFAEGAEEFVVSFESLRAPFDRWRLVIRPVSLARPFYEEFLEKLECFAGVSASLFVDGDAFAALGELEVESRSRDELECLEVPSPFPYDEHMRVVALNSRGELERETAEALATLARHLGGRTLGLFTSLKRMNAVAAILAEELREDGIEVLAPRAAGDDPRVLVERFRRGSSVLLGARTFWQGLDIQGDALQAVVIEKYPFEVPTELRKRREQRFRGEGVDVFNRYALGKMLLYLKQMVGRLIRSEEDRGIVVIVEGRTDRRYFRKVVHALPRGTELRVTKVDELSRFLEELGIHA